MDNQLELVQAYEHAVFTLNISLKLIKEWECDTRKLEEILRINHRGWELLFKTSHFTFSNKPLKETHRLRHLIPNITLNYDKENSNKLFYSDMFQNYFKLLDDVFAQTSSRYNVINDLQGKESSHYTVDAWIKKQDLHLKENFYEHIRTRILEINNISLRCFYINMVDTIKLRPLSVILQNWSTYDHEWFIT